MVKKPPKFRGEKPKRDFVQLGAREDRGSIFLKHLWVLLVLAGQPRLRLAAESSREGLTLDLVAGGAELMGFEFAVDLSGYFL